MNEPATIVPGRSCNDCAMCCKLLEIRALDKPAGQWCTHCSTRQKCDIYMERPAPCRTFYCGYMLQAGIPESWHPINSRMIITSTGDGEHLFIQVDPSRPDAWRRTPYLQQLREWARINNPTGQQIIVSVGGRYIIIFPDREQDLGPVGADETVTFTVTQTITGPVTEAHKHKIR